MRERKGEREREEEREGESGGKERARAKEGQKPNTHQTKQPAEKGTRTGERERRD